MGRDDSPQKNKYYKGDAGNAIKLFLLIGNQDTRFLDVQKNSKGPKIFKCLPKKNY